MTQLFFSTLPDLVIPTGQADSNVIDFLRQAYDSEAISVGSPTGLEAFTYTWLASNDKGVTYFTVVDSANVAITVPAAGKMQVYNGVFTGITNLKLHSSGNVVANNTFKVAKNSRA